MPGDVRGDGAERPGEPVHRVASAPRPCRVRAHPAQLQLDAHHPLAPRLDHAPGRLAHDRGVTVEQRLVAGSHLEEPAALAGDLLAHVVDPGHLGGEREVLDRQLGHDRERPLHVARAEAADLAVGHLDAGVPRDRVQVPGHDDPALPRPRRARDDVVADPGDLERGGGAQLALHLVGERALGAGHRGDLDVARRALDEGHVATPCARRVSFSAARSWRSPSSSRCTTRTHGIENSPPG